MEYADVGEASATQARGQDYKNNTGQRGFMKKRGTVDKRNMVCDYCNKTGHGRDTCFKLHGVPEWYRDLNEQKKRSSINRAYAVAETQNSVNRPTPQEADLVSDLLEALKTIQSNKVLQDPVQVHFTRDMEMADSILVATHIINLLPSVILDWKSPFELLYKSPPCYDNLKTFGCLCYATNTFPHKTKFDPRAFQCIFIGYVPRQKGYRFYDLVNKVTITSRDVILHEHIFPFQSISSVPESTGPILVSTHTLDNMSTPAAIVDSETSTSVPAEPSPSPIPPMDIVPELPLRRSTRQPKTPTWLSDFQCNHSSASFIDPTTLASSHVSFLAALSTFQEPSSYREAKGCKEWEEAMKQELDALERNDIWTVVRLPSGKKVIGNKWVYKLKLKADGSIDRYKARLVAKGYNQVEGVDYVDRFSSVAKAVTVRTFLALAFSYTWPIHQGHVCKLKKSLYGLKQASRQWNLELTSKLLSFGFHQSAHDHCLFLKHTEDGMLALLVYVDDVLITCSSEAQIAVVKHFLDSTFTIKDLGLAKYFLGLEIARSPFGTSITQHKFIRDIIRDAGLQSAKPASSPLPPGLKLSAHTSPPLSDAEPYRRLVGRLLYLSFTRPDISFGAQQLSQFVHAPCAVHLDVAMHLVRYLKGCPERGLFFPAHNSLSLMAYCDVDWASCTDSRRSLTGYCIFLGNALISWKTKKQTTVARSTAEAEYRSLGSTVCELQWITYLLADLQVHVLTPIFLYCDNQAAIYIVANPVFHERTKHLEIDCHLVRDKFKAGFVLPLHISGSDQLADVFTKSLSGSHFSTLLSKLGLVSFPQVHLEGG
ncbi:UNVERIFIED_CONTAM: Retrovirus-related Pol polyprotein from transposon RE1 [Sesamum radiatum]|uniref:Retrovirus-related Pol polyprotein from transposon RE1 n=1 Tax=Sesamum radiatum TaxID=300843 RepID=A0AAW2RZE8_SESRA